MNQDTKWQEEFDNTFPSSRHTSDIYPREELKSFIQKTRQEAKEEERERCAKIVENWMEDEENWQVISEAVFETNRKNTLYTRPEQ